MAENSGLPHWEALGYDLRRLLEADRATFVLSPEALLSHRVEPGRVYFEILNGSSATVGMLLAVAQPGQLRPLILIQRAAPIAAAALVGVHPVPERPGVDPQVPGYLSYWLAGLADQPDRALPEIVIKLPACLCHRRTPLRRVHVMRGSAPGALRQDPHDLVAAVDRWPDDGAVRWSAGGGGWQLSPVTGLLVAAALAMAGNLATSTVQVNWQWWPWIAWSAVVTLVAASVVIELARAHAGRDAASAAAIDRAVETLADKVKDQCRQFETGGHGGPQTHFELAGTGVHGPGVGHFPLSPQ
jgi:hypothetical protein